jgi:hypothetical protein
MNNCNICIHPNRLAIDKKIVEGCNLSRLSTLFGVEYHSLYNHAQHHIPRSLARAMEKKLMIEGNELMEIITRIVQRAEDIFIRNYNKEKDLLALKALDSQRNTIQLLSNISAQIHAAKMAEIELAKRNSGEDEEQRKLENAERLKVLTFEELLVYERFVNKLLHKNADVIIKNGKIMSYNRPKSDNE